MWDCVQVKEEPWEGVSAEAAREGLYGEHEAKREVLVGPEVLQPQDAAFRSGPKMEVTVVKEELSAGETYGTANCANEQGDYSDERGPFTKNGRQKVLLKPCTVRLERILVDNNKKQHSGKNAKIQHKVLCPKLKGHDTHINKSDRFKNILSNNINIHTKAGTFTCDSCGLPFTLRKNIIRHLRTCSNQASKVKRKIFTPLSCKTCNKQFKARYNLTRHEQTHSRLKPYNCEICGRQYSQISHLYRHKRTHTAQPRNIETHSCETCSKKYRKKYDLVIHMRVHTGQMPYVCRCCNKRFNKKSTLVNHEKIHAETRSYTCEVCNKQFALKWNLTKHKRSHTRETPYSCDVCGKKFMHSYSLTKHKRGRQHSVNSALLTNSSSKDDCALKVPQNCFIEEKENVRNQNIHG